MLFRFKTKLKNKTHITSSCFYNVLMGFNARRLVLLIVLLAKSGLF